MKSVLKIFGSSDSNKSKNDVSEIKKQVGCKNKNLIVNQYNCNSDCDKWWAKQRQINDEFKRRHDESDRRHDETERRIDEIRCWNKKYDERKYFSSGQAYRDFALKTLSEFTDEDNYL